MNLKTAKEMLASEARDYKATSDYFETIFPGATSAYRDLERSHNIAVFAINAMIATHGEDFEPALGED